MTTSESHDRPANRLAEARSPYLLLHKHNPVDWYPWGPEALARARDEEKPIFLSVGYSTCYWCHVMERESFSDPRLAAYMNEHFVSVKVDREERPDLDEIYMVATQLLTQRGGWPNSVFLTPDLQPFYAGTYFPPEDRHGLPGFSTVLRGLVQAWEGRRDQIMDQAARIVAAMREYLSEAPAGAADLPRQELVDAAYEGLRRQFDAAWGGFGGAPKFPSPANLFLLLELADRPQADEMLDATLDQMARGGIYDQLGGGFHRYATDREWKIPHFEKMLYDNGLLLEAYAQAHLRRPTPQRERILRQTTAFLASEMTSPEGGFWSAIDAETEGHEGAFYVWTADELRGLLGEEDAAFLAPLFGFEGPPFFEGSHYVLHLPRPLEEQAALRQSSVEEIWSEVEPLRRKLFDARGRRERPRTDDKILADWNGLAIAGLAWAGRALADEGVLEQARRAARFVLEHHWLHSGAAPALRHSWREGEAAIDGFLADYAYMVRGLLALHEATGAEEWLAAARELTVEQVELLETPEGGFFAAAAAPDLLLQSRDAYDDALPNANGVAVLNLLDLHAATGEERWRETAVRALVALAPAAERQPMAARTLVLAGHRLRGRPGEAPPSRKGPAAGVTSPETLVRHRLRVDEGEGWRPFVLELEIEEGWHLHANPASEEPLIPTRLEAVEGELRNVTYPEGEPLEVGSSDAPLSVYQGVVCITGELRLEGERALCLTYQACDERRCLEVAERRIVVE